MEQARKDEAKRREENRKRDFEFLRKTYGPDVERFDTDLDGQLSDEERAAAEIIFERASKARMNKIARTYDRNKDGIWDWSEQENYARDVEQRRLNPNDFKFDFVNPPSLADLDKESIRIVPALPPGVRRRDVVGKFPFDAAKAILKWPESISGPDPLFLEWLTPSDKPRLFRAYRGRDLKGRAALAEALAQVSGEDAGKAFIQTLENDCRKWTLSDEDIQHFRGILFALGRVAAKSQTGFAYLTNHITPAAWKGAYQWPSRFPEFEYSAMLAGCSIQALGISGRPEVPDIVQHLIDQKPDYLARISGDIVSVHYYWRIVHDRGPKGLWELTYDDTLKHYGRWRQTDEGKRWSQWYEKIRAEQVRGLKPK